MKILIVDDSADDRILLQTILKKAGHKELIFAESGSDALALLAEMRLGRPRVLPSLVLMDVDMPGKSGLDTLARLRADQGLREIPVIMVTGKSSIGDIAAGFETGATDYIPKPFNKVELLARVNAVLALEEATRKLRLSEKRMRDLTSALGEGLVSLGPDNEVVFINPAGERLLGADNVSPDSLDGQRWHGLAHPDGKGCPGGGKPCPMASKHPWEGSGRDTVGETTILRRDGKAIPIAFTASTICDKGEILGRVIAFRDVTESRKAEERLRLAANIIENSQEGIMIVEPGSRRILDVNPAFTQITGYSAEEALGNTPRLLSSDRQDAEFYQSMWNSLERTGRWRGEIWNKRKDGVVFPEWLSISSIQDADGRTTHFVGLFSDITSRKMMEERLKHRAHHDLLTGLPNRGLLLDRLTQSLAKAHRDGTLVGLLYLDLDGFKPINDTFGHGAGDAVLKDVANKLRMAVRKSDTAARLGGDEFVLILNDVQNPADLTAVADKILGALAVDILIEGNQCRVGASIGLALFPQDAQNVESLLARADEAMYRAKQNGRNQFFFWSNEQTNQPAKASG